jgi:hypothetical protein
MLEKLFHSHDGKTGGPQFCEAPDRLAQIVLDGLRHGHFRCAIISEIGKNKRRELMIEAGKSHRFTIPDDELRDRDAEHANDNAIQRHRWDSEAGDQGRGTARCRPEIFGETIVCKRQLQR